MAEPLSLLPLLFCIHSVLIFHAPNSFANATSKTIGRTDKVTVKMYRASKSAMYKGIKFGTEVNVWAACATPWLVNRAR